MAAHQAPPSLGFSRQEHWSGLPFPSPMHESEKWKWSCSVIFYSWWPHGLQPTRLLRPWHFPGKSTGVRCHCLLWSHLRSPLIFHPLLKSKIIEIKCHLNNLCMHWCLQGEELPSILEEVIASNHFSWTGSILLISKPLSSAQYIVKCSINLSLIFEQTWLRT